MAFRMSALNPGEAAAPAPGHRFSALSERRTRIVALLGKRLIQIRSCSSPCRS